MSLPGSDAAAPLALPAGPVYAEDLRTLIGRMVTGKGFVPLGVDPRSVPDFPVQQGPSFAAPPDEPRSLTMYVRRATGQTAWFAVCQVLANCLTKIEPIHVNRPLISMEAALDPPARPVRPSLEPLVAAARAGDRDAFRALVEPHLAVALGASTVLTGSAADGDDAVQEALLSAWQGLGSLREPDAFPAWFRRQVIRAASRASRARGRRRVVELDVSLPIATDALDRIVERRTLGRAFDSLDQDDRLLLTLHHIWSLPVAETAAILGVPNGTVKSRVHYAMQRLRAGYDAEDRR